MIATGARHDPNVQLLQHLDSLREADRLRFIVETARRAIGAGLAVDVALLLAMRLALIPVEHAWLVLPPVALVVASLVAAALRRPNPLHIAQVADRQLGLQERLTTAVELAQRHSEQVFTDLQLQDTLAHLRRRGPGEAFPLPINWPELALTAAMAAAVAWLLVTPPPQRPAFPQVEQVQGVIKQEAERVSALAEDLDAGQTNADRASRAEIVRALREASRAMGRQPDSAEQAVAALAAAEQKLAAQQSLRAEDLRQAITRAADALRREGTTREVGSNLARGDAEGTTNALRSLGEKAGAMSAAQRAGAAQALRSAASNASSFDPRLAQSLREASDALAASDPAAQEAISRAATALEQAAQEVGRQELVEKALSQLEQSRAAIGNAAQPSDAAGSQERRAAPRPAAAPKAGTESGSGEGQQGSTQAERQSQPSARGNPDSGRQDGGDGQGEPGGGGIGQGSLNRTGSELDPNSLGSRDEHLSSAGFDRPSVSASEHTVLPDQGDAAVDYRDVYATYRERATVATQDRYIPLDLKELVRDYFSSLDPSR